MEIVKLKAKESTDRLANNVKINTKKLSVTDLIQLLTPMKMLETEKYLEK